MPTSLALSALSFAVAMIVAKPLLAALRRLHISKQVSSDAPPSHSIKAGTTTMGGIIIFVTVLLVTVPFNLVGRLSILLPLAVMVGCGVLGAVDDLLNLIGGRGRGMTAPFKFAWLLAISVVTALVLHYLFELTSIFIPFAGKFDIGLWYLPVAVVAVLGTANAVNLTDGLDALAGGTAAIAFAAYGVIAFLQGQQYLVTFSFTVVGATLAFLWYNAYPAQVFMGDTGSLALGATLATVALMTGHWLLLPLIGLVFVMEACSVLLQVAYFKLSGGRRLFRMSPLHHHFELKGWSETQVTTRFWLLGIVGAILGIALALSY
jgi:phospho-N-acetylmuramoyl-pentapeptide-transferase